MKTNIKQGDRIFFLHRSAYEITDMNKVVLTMNIVERDGVLHAVSVLEPFPKSFTISSDFIELSNNHPMPYLFDNRADAEAQYQKEINNRAQSIKDQPKDELLKEMYQMWFHEQRLHPVEVKAMKEKLKTDFGVDVDAE